MGDLGVNPLQAASNPLLPVVAWWGITIEERPTGGQRGTRGLLTIGDRTDRIILSTQAMPRAFESFHLLFFLLIATILEVSGDAVVRMAIYDHVGLVRLGLFICGGALLFGYGSFLNLAPLEFGQVAGLYIATLFIVWQVINYVAFRSLPTMPIVLGGLLVIAGGTIVTFWKPS